MRKPEEIITCYARGNRVNCILVNNYINPETGVMLRRVLQLEKSKSTGKLNFWECPMQLSMMTISNLGDVIAWDDLPSAVRCRAWDWAQLASEARCYRLNTPREIVTHGELRFNIRRLLYEAPEVFGDLEIIGMYVAMDPVLATMYLGDTAEAVLESWYTDEFEGEPEEDRELALRASPARDFMRTYYPTGHNELFIEQYDGDVLRFYCSPEDAREKRIEALHAAEEEMYKAKCTEVAQHGMTMLRSMDELVALRSDDEKGTNDVHCGLTHEERVRLISQTIAKLNEEAGFKENIAMTALYAFNRATPGMLRIARDAWESNFAEGRESLCVERHFPSGGIELSGTLANGEYVHHEYFDYTVAEAIKMFLNEFPEVE